MPCTGDAYATAEDFAIFWFTGVVWQGYHTGGVANPALNDPTIDFVEAGILGGVGHWLWNITQSTDGLITAVSGNTVTGNNSTWDDGDEYQLSKLTTRERSSINMALKKAASDVQAVLHAANQCNCAWGAWATEYVKKLNIIDAVAYYNNACGNPRFSDDFRLKMLDWVSGELKNITMSIVTLCDGETGANYPAMAFAQQAWTPEAAAQIIFNDAITFL